LELHNPEQPEASDAAAAMRLLAFRQPAGTSSTNQQNHFTGRHIYNCIASGRLSLTVSRPADSNFPMTPRPNHLTLVTSQPQNSGDERLRRTLDLIGRLGGGWQPDQACLAGARHAERWTVNHQPDAMAYQFIGWPQQAHAKTSLIIASVVAIDPAERWALLFGDRWVTLGTRAPETEPFDPNDIVVRAEAWLRSQSS
jgi:hypothetical protein